MLSVLKTFNETLFSNKVTTKWLPPKGLFVKPAKEIATVLKNNSENLKQAMSRINFYINRAGSNLSNEDQTKFKKAKQILDQLYGK